MSINTLRFSQIYNLNLISPNQRINFWALTFPGHSLSRLELVLESPWTLSSWWSLLCAELSKFANLKKIYNHGNNLFLCFSLGKKQLMINTAPSSELCDYKPYYASPLWTFFPILLLWRTVINRFLGSSSKVIIDSSHSKKKKFWIKMIFFVMFHV